MANRFEDRFINYHTDQISYDENGSNYSVDENLDGEIDYSFRNPDFNFMQFRSNLVLRWEYIPGSELYLVWSQGITNSGNPEEDLIPSLRENLFTEKARNIFLLKYTYRFIK